MCPEGQHYSFEIVLVAACSVCLAMVSYLVSQYTSSLYKFVKCFRSFSCYYLSARIIIFIGVVSSHSISL